MEHKLLKLLVTNSGPISQVEMCTIKLHFRILAAAVLDMVRTLSVSF